MWIDKIMGDARVFLRSLVTGINGNATSTASETLENVVTTDGEALKVSLVASSTTPTPAALIAAPQTLTNAYADLGAEVACSGYSYLGVWIKCTVQASTGISVKALAKHTSAGTEEYSLPIQTVSTTEIAVTPEIVTFPDGTNFLYLLVVNLFNVVPYVQFQVKFTTDSGADATIDTAYITRG